MTPANHTSEPSTEPPEASRRTRALARRWRMLRDAAAPVLPAPALVVALALVASLLLGFVLQFATSVFDTRPDLAYGQAFIDGALAVALAVMMMLRPRWHRAHVVVLGLAALVVLGALWTSGAKLQYRRGLAGNAFYTLPHQPFRYDPPAETVWLTTTDGVRLAGTQIAHHRSRAVLIYPGWRTNRDAFSVATLAQWLANSMDVLVVDPRGQGESAGAKTPDGAEKYDVLAGVAYLKSSGHTHIGALTEEDGAPAAVAAATLHEGMDSLALVAPANVWGESLGQDGRFYDPHGLPGRFYWRIAAGLRLAPGAAGTPVSDAIRFVAPTPLLLAACKTEAGSTIDQLHLAAGEPKSLIVLGGEGRPVNWGHFAEYYKAIEQWFDLTLREPPPPEPPAGG